MSKPSNRLLIFILLLLAALVLRVSIARFFANEDLYDGKVYSQLAKNIVEHGKYSTETQPPYLPSLIRLPGYPLLLAGVYSIFGSDDDTAVRIVQALIDTATCALVALLAFYWEPDQSRKRAAAIGALALAAVCPFTSIYVATLLSETSATFLMLATCLAATLAFNEKVEKRAIVWWLATGVLAGLAVLFRPDAALVALAVGITLIISIVFAPRDLKQRPDGKHETPLRFARASYLGAIFTLAFCLVLVPWAIRNWRVFHVFQPLAPAYGQTPGEFVPRGYYLWLRTWLDDERDVAPLIWSLDSSPIEIDDIPDRAFDSAEEKQRVAVLLDQYNHPHQNLPSDSPASSLPPDEDEQPSPSSETSTITDEEDDEDEQPTEGATDLADDTEGKTVAMTPAIDAGFAQLARERISRSPLRHYVVTPVRRAANLWFNTHSQYYPFEGELFPEEGVRHTTAQQVWLPFFTALTWIYTFLALVGCWYLWTSGKFSSRRWLLLAVLIFVSRLAFFAFRVNPEPRYVVELFPLVSALGGIALVRVVESFRSRTQS